MRIAPHVMSLILDHLHVRMDQRKVLVICHFEQLGWKTHFERGCPQGEIRLDHGPVHLERGVARHAFARRLDPTAKAANAMAQWNVPQVNLGDDMAS